MKKTEYKLLDSSAWLLYFIGHEQIRRLIESDYLIFTSALSLFEIRRKLMREKVVGEQIQQLIDFIKERSALLDVTTRVSEKGAVVSVEYKLAAIDALIYTSAQDSNATLVTGDNDFRGLANVTILSA